MDEAGQRLSVELDLPVHPLGGLDGRLRERRLGREVRQQLGRQRRAGARRGAPGRRRGRRPAAGGRPTADGWRGDGSASTTTPAVTPTARAVAPASTGNRPEKGRPLALARRDRILPAFPVAVRPARKARCAFGDGSVERHLVAEPGEQVHLVHRVSSVLAGGQVAERSPQVRPGPADPGADRADGDAEGGRRLLVGQPAPGDEQQRVPVGGLQARQRRGQPSRRGGRRQPFVDLVGERGDDRVDPGPRERLVQPDLVPPVAAEQVGRDPVQPRQRVRAGRVVAGPLPEGQQERLRDDVVGRVRAQPPHHVTLDPRLVPLEQHLELLRLGQREPDDRGVVEHVYGVHVELLPGAAIPVP